VLPFVFRSNPTFVYSENPCTCPHIFDAAFSLLSVVALDLCTYVGQCVSCTV
jgi:hypothetical protein